ncbi:MAG: hypothetical protein K2F60_01295, partial [Oscillospiraceae bacterium]|nr:hypothetical protein [Oscillospiraceae bacterium]
VKGLPNWRQKNYVYCPFAMPTIKRTPNDEEWLTEIDDDVIALYDMLKEQFDRVVYLLEKELNIRCSKNFWKNVLKQYLTNEAYLYPWLTESNLPYLFVYFGMQHQRLYKQQIRVDSQLYNALKKHSDTILINQENGYARHVNRKGTYCELFFRFTDFKQRAVDGETLNEFMKFCIDDRKTGKTIFQKTITFQETYFINLINNRNNENKRQQWLLDIADELMKPL